MPAPVGHTCSTIDGIIDDIKNALKAYNYCYGHTEDLENTELDDYQQNRLNDLFSELRDIEYYIYDLEGKMEEVRDANSKLRDWGDELESELEDLRDEF